MHGADGTGWLVDVYTCCGRWLCTAMVLWACTRGVARTTLRGDRRRDRRLQFPRQSIRLAPIVGIRDDHPKLLACHLDIRVLRDELLVLLLAHCTTGVALGTLAGAAALEEVPGTQQPSTVHTRHSAHHAPQ